MGVKQNPRESFVGRDQGGTHEILHPAQACSALIPGAVSPRWRKQKSWQASLLVTRVDQEKSKRL